MKTPPPGVTPRLHPHLFVRLQVGQHLQEVVPGGGVRRHFAKAEQRRLRQVHHQPTGGSWGVGLGTAAHVGAQPRAVPAAARYLTTASKRLRSRGY